jgi:hypothetical protein
MYLKPLMFIDEAVWSFRRGAPLQQIIFELNVFSRFAQVHVSIVVVNTCVQMCTDAYRSSRKRC